MKLLAVFRNIDDAVNKVVDLKPELAFRDVELGHCKTDFKLLKSLVKIDFDVFFTISHIDANL